MKQKNDLSQPATKGDLIELEQKLEKRFEKKFATKLQLHIELENFELRVDDKARKYRDQILTRLDQVMGELQNIREDTVFKNRDISKLRKDIDSHEQRIAKLEKSKHN